MVHEIWNLLHHHDPLALFALLAVEESGVPIPVPGDIVMMYAGYRVHLGRMFWYEALIAGVLATLVGSCILYMIGKRGGRPLMTRFGRYLHLTNARQARIERWLGRYGALAVFVGRLIPGMRCGSSFVAGTFGVRYPTFVVATAASAFVWWGLFLYIGSEIGVRVAPIIQRHANLWFVWVAVVVLVFAIPAYRQYRREKAGAAEDAATPILTANVVEAPLRDSLLR